VRPPAAALPPRALPAGSGDPSQPSSPASGSWFTPNPPSGPAGYTDDRARHDPPGPPRGAGASEPQVSPDDDTAPLPVVLPDKPANGHPRGPFEPATRSPESLAAQEEAPEPGRARAPKPPLPPPEPAVPGGAKLDQIKDLYLTAEAIGEDALNQHFEQVSDRQRQLIKEYFDQATGDRETGKARSPGP
jgi:hypothetical protein